VKGVGECGVVPVCAAVASAVQDALSPFSVHITQMPLFPAHVVAMIAEARAKQKAAA
jgi:carbon-monoxide dehydrogenase large subunit